MNVPPPAAEADVVGPTFFDLLRLARCLASILGGMVSLILREGSFGVVASTKDEEEAIGAALGLEVVVRGLFAQVHSPSQTGQISLSSSSSIKRFSSTPTVWG